MDAELVVRAQGGDRDAFASIATLTYGRLHHVAQNILSDVDRADDATQQAVVDIWRKLPQLRDPRKFEAWSYRVVVNCCYAEARKGQRWLPGLATERDEDPRGDRFYGNQQALRVTNAGADIRDNEFVGNWHTVQLTDTDATLADNTIRGGDYGISVTSSGSPVITGNIIENARVSGLFAGNGTSPSIVANEICGSSNNLLVAADAAPTIGENDVCPDIAVAVD